MSWYVIHMLATVTVKPTTLPNQIKKLALLSAGFWNTSNKERTSHQNDCYAFYKLLSFFQYDSTFTHYENLLQRLSWHEPSYFLSAIFP